MANKTIYWIPVIGAFVSLANYDKETGLSESWAYYQAIMIIATIWIISFFVFYK
jgi:hypothetical protein